MTDTRRAALVLHGLPPDDREWMLAQLPGHQAEALRALLHELHGLGVPADAHLMRDALARSLHDDAPNVACLARASAGQMHALLRNEPDLLVAAVVSASQWPWRAALLERLGTPRAQRVRELAHVQPFAACSRRAVLDELARRMSLVGVAGHKRPGRWAALRALTPWWATWSR
jgi:hypothetical protein